MEYGSACLALSLLEDEMIEDADEHIWILELAPSSIGKSLSNFIAITGGNVDVNRSISAKMRIPQLCCTIHQFYIEVKEIFYTEENIIT